MAVELGKQKNPNEWADFWRELGVNVIPADTGNPNKDKRKPVGLELCNNTWIQWKDNPIPIELHEAWKKERYFEKGMAVICGKTFHKSYDLYLNGIDCDNKLATEEFWKEGLEDKTLVEQHKNTQSKCHIYYFTEKRGMKPRSSNKNTVTDTDAPLVEVQSNGKLMFCTASPHSDGSNYEMIGTSEILNVPVEDLEQMVDNICKKHGMSYLKSTVTSTEERVENLKLKTKNTNRQAELLSLATTYALKVKGIVDEENVIDYTKKLNQELAEPYSEARAVQIGKSAYKYSIDNKSDPEIEIKTELKANWDILKNNHSTDEMKDGAREAINELQAILGSEITQWDESPYALFTKNDFDIVAQKIQNDIHFVTIRENKAIWYYSQDEEIYKPLGDTIIEELCQRYIRKCTKNTVAEVVDTVRRKTMIYLNDLLDSKHINTKNGILDPNTFELKPHSHEFLTTTKLPFSINHNARNLKLWNHILSIIDPKDITLFMELIWICISWNNPFKKMFVFKGDPDTQKTTLADILVWIIGKVNVARQKPESFLLKGSRFGTSHFIGKRINIASEIGNFTKEMLENQKSLIGAELQNTEEKNSNAEKYFDPTKFVFLYTTNELGDIYSSINDNSTITRLQFMIFRNKLNQAVVNGQWYDTFFDDDEDKQSAIDTIVNIVINYKKAQSLGKIPITSWSTIAETKQILQEQMPKEDKYFKDERIIQRGGSRLTLEEIKSDFESFVGYKVTSLELGHILKKNGMKSKSSNGITYFQGYSFNTEKDQMVLN